MKSKSFSKRAISFLLSFVIFSGLAAGCSNTKVTNSNPVSDNSKKESNVNKTGFPIVKEKITLNVTAGQQPIQSDFNDMVILKNFEEKSNIDINWTCIPAEFVVERRNIIMASADLPDMFFKMGFSGVDIAKYSQQGLFVKMSDMIDTYAPNIADAFQQWPDVKAGLTMTDGHIYSLGYILGAPAITSGGKIFFNSKALEKIGKPIPTTLDELEEVLKAFKTVDMNGNNKNDEVPLTSSGFEYIETCLKGSFGLGNRGANSAFVDINEKTNELRFIYSSDEYKALLQYMNKLFKDGLIDQEIFTMDTPKLIAKGEEGRALSYVFANHSIVGNKYGDDSVGMTVPFKGPYGDQIWSPQQSALSGMGAAVITTQNKYPEASMRWLDYWFSDDGNREFFMGIEGETYEMTADGECVYTDFVLKNPDGIHFERVLGKYVPWAGGGNPSIASDKYFKGGEMHPIGKASSDSLNKYAPKIIWPQFMFESSEVDEMASIRTNIQTYINENRALFVTGKRSFDEWDKYVKGYKKLKVDKYLEVYKKAVTRYGF